MSVSFSPIGPWFLLALASVAVMVLTVWAYQHRLSGTSGRWRWVALGLRLGAVLLCLIAALRPSIVLQEKRKQASTVLIELDGSKSMGVTDEVSGEKRSAVAKKVLQKAIAGAKNLGPDTDVKVYGFDSKLRDLAPDDAREPEGRETAIGSSLLDAVKRHSGHRISTIILLSDGASNFGIAPLVAAEQLKNQQIPVVTVGFGSENAGAGSRDIIVRELVTAPTVFVKNQLEVKGTLVVRGFANRELNVEMLVDDQATPVANKKIKVPEGSEVVPITGLKYIPQSPGEKKVTLRVKPEKGELIETNNEVSTFVSVLKGGLNVLFLQGPNFTWEFKFLFRSIGSSPDIQVVGRVIRKPAQGDVGELKDEELAPGKYDVYVLGDMPASHLTRNQQRLLADVVEKGSAGLMMLGGRASFGAGGWAGTELARIAPVELHPGDGQLEPEGGIKFVPNPDALDNYVLQIGRDRADSARIWNSLPPLPGTNRFGQPKKLAVILGQTPPPNSEPIMLNQETGQGRVLAFGGETWVWARAHEEGLKAHRKFWRQAILWLSHKEDQGDNQVKIKLETRRIALGEKLDIMLSARDSKGTPVTDVTYDIKVARDAPDAKPVSIEPFVQGEGAHGIYYAMEQPGTYRITASAKRNGEPIGSDSVRFLVYQDDREMENPAADRALLRQIAEVTGGASLSPEELDGYLKGLSGKMVTEYVTQSEHRIWDNWPFLTLFATLLTLEWWLRKRHGWV